MIIYFLGSFSGKKQYIENYRKIVETTRKLGHTVLYNNILELSLEDILAQTTKERMKVHAYLRKLKLQSDVVMIEASFKSFALGQEIAHAFRIGKPVLILHVQGQLPHFILSDAGDRVLVSEYNFENIKEKITEGLAFLNPHETKRFTMNMPSSIVDFLDTISRENNTTRSEYIRDLITSEMHKVRSKKV